MMKKKLLLMLMVAVLVAGTAQANEAPNAGFEEGDYSAEPGTLPEGWTGSSSNGGDVLEDIIWIDDAGVSHSGSKCMEMITHDGSEPYLWPIDLVPVTGGEEYDFSVWAKSIVLDPENLPVNHRTEAFIVWYTADFVDLFDISPKWQLSPVDECWPIEWTKWEIGTFTAPANAAYVDFNLVTWEGHDPNTGFYYDDVVISGPGGLGAPDVDAGVDMVTWPNEPVLLDPVVVNNDPCDPQRSLIYSWTASPSEGVVFTDSNDILDPIVTIDIDPTENPSIITLTLTVSIDGDPAVFSEDSMYIEVYDDACEAAKGKYGQAKTDLDGDCITNINDLIEVAILWLTGDELPGPQIKTE